MKKIAFGGGCHWCTEAVFQSIQGVVRVDQGWVSSVAPHNNFSEAVVVHYDPNEISLKTLIEIHLLTHSSSSQHVMRNKYRSAIYYFDEETMDQSRQILNMLIQKDQKLYITMVLPMVEFKLNQESYLDYFRRQPEAPFCRTYIVPKLKKLKKEFKDEVKQL